MPWTDQPTKRSYACIPEVLAFARERKGLTQRELAEAAGYSERLISKAEAGKAISVETIANLAESLSCPEAVVHPEDLIADPVKLAKDYVSALYEHGGEVLDAIRHFLDERIVVRISGDPEHIPFAGEHHGIEAFDRAFRLFFSVLEAPTGHDPLPHYSFLGRGNEVRVWGESWIHPIGRPLSEPMPISNRFVFERGKLILFEDIFDTDKGKRELARD